MDERIMQKSHETEFVKGCKEAAMGAESDGLNFGNTLQNVDGGNNSLIVDGHTTLAILNSVADHNSIESMVYNQSSALEEKYEKLSQKLQVSFSDVLYSNTVESSLERKISGRKRRKIMANKKGLGSVCIKKYFSPAAMANLDKKDEIQDNENLQNIYSCINGFQQYEAADSRSTANDINTSIQNGNTRATSSKNVNNEIHFAANATCYESANKNMNAIASEESPTEDCPDCISLISMDNVVFKVKRDIAMQSATIKTFLNPFYPSNTPVTSVKLPIQSMLLKRCIEFMEFKGKNKMAIVGESNLEESEEFKVTDEETIELLDVASYLRL